MADIRFIDISFAQGTVNWDTIEQSINKGSIDGVIIRAGYGGGGIDNQFVRNRDEARRRGIPRAFYFFAYPGRSNGAAQAQEFLDRVGPLQDGEVIALDMEDEAQYGRRLVADDVAWSREFLDKCSKIFGVKPLIYINTDVKSRFNWQPVVDGDYGLWVANYGTNNGDPQTEPLATPWPFWAIWQYTSRASVAGLSPVDANIVDGDLNTFRSYGYKSPIAPPSVVVPDPIPMPVPDPTPTPVDPTPSPAPTPDTPAPANPTPLPPIEPTPVKPGWKTSEFYAAALLALPAIAKLAGLDLTPDTISSLLDTAIYGTLAIAGVVTYIVARWKIKTAAINKIK